MFVSRKHEFYNGSYFNLTLSGDAILNNIDMYGCPSVLTNRTGQSGESLLFKMEALRKFETKISDSEIHLSQIQAFS